MFYQHLFFTHALATTFTFLHCIRTYFLYKTCMYNYACITINGSRLDVELTAQHPVTEVFKQ